MNNQTCIDPPQLKSQAERRAYQSPRLSVLGDVCQLTETGSRDGMEDWVQNNVCMLWGLGEVNMTYNMC